MDDGLYYLYHLRDPEKSAGFGLDSYTGTTNNTKRRFREHTGAAAKGTHSNRHVQRMFDEANGKLQMHLVRSGTRDEILASEGLIVNKPNLHANVQSGGGPLRGKTQDELIKLSRSKRTRKDDFEAPTVKVRTLSTGEIVLIATVVLVVAGGVYYLYRRRKSNEQALEVSTVPVLDVSATSSNDFLNEQLERERVLAERAAREAKMASWKQQVKRTNVPAVDPLATSSNDPLSEQLERERVLAERAAREAKMASWKRQSPSNAFWGALLKALTPSA